MAAQATPGIGIGYRLVQRLLCCLALGLCLSLPADVHALGTPRFVDLQGKEGVRLADKGRAAPIVVGTDDYPGVLRAARDLQRDIRKVTGKTPGWQTGAAAGSDVIIVGTLGRHPLIDDLARQGRIDTRDLAGQWEGFLVQAVSDPLPGVKRALVIAGSDKRGTIYGIYTLSEQIGVSPWHWWADVPVARHAALSVPLGTRLMDKPAVQYRGIFLNDEAPALTNWAKERFGGFNRQFHAQLFELMLRLRANYLWPAMWGSAFYDDDKKNGELADMMGIVMGTSHHEPMMRAHQEWVRHGKGPWDYGRNADTLREFWAGGLRNTRKDTRDHEKVITMGMRGDGDEPMSESANVALLERIVRDQRALIKQELGKDPATVPQLWALYKEVQEYYEKGMRVPDDMLLLWCDDNWGNIRRLPTPEERKRSGGAGVYYHFDYVGGPRSYKWLNVTQIAKVWEQMNLANEYGANRLWIVNVGDLKPMEIPTEFFLAYAWNPAAWPAEKLPAYLEAWAAREFGPRHAARIASIVERYTRYNARRRPEQLEPTTYSLSAYDEAERVVNDYNALVEEARQVGKALPKAMQDAWFQLVEYPVRASANALDMWVSAGRNALYARQGRVTTNDMAARVRRLFERDAELTRQYHGVNQGKWHHMMSQNRFGYTNWAQPYRDVMPAVSALRVPDRAAPGGIRAADPMGVVVQGSQAVWPAYGLHHMTVPALDVFDRQPRYIELFNRSSEPFAYAVEASHPWIRLSHAAGRVDKEQRILVDVDWDAAPAGSTQAELTVSGPEGARVVVKVPVHKPEGLTPQSAQGHVESRGVVAIEAEHFSRAHAPQGRRWLRIPGYGHTLSGMTTKSASSASAVPALTIEDGMRLEYDVHLFRGGELKLHAVLGPTLKFQPGKGFRFAVSIDDGPPQEVNVHADESEHYWNRMVSDGVARFVTTHRVERPGRHTVKFWALDPGLVLQRLVIDAGGLQPSYLGPPESPYYPAKRESARP